MGQFSRSEQKNIGRKRIKIPTIIDHQDKYHAHAS